MATNHAVSAAEPLEKVKPIQPATQAGLIQSKMPKDLNTVPGYEAQQVQLDNKDTVAGQLDTITSKSSPLMKRAASQGLQQANQRGLLNSSMAVDAAQGAVLDRALPIASQDAQTSFQTKAMNTDAVNAARQFTAANIHDRQLQAADIEGRSRLQQEAGQIESRLIKERGEIEKALVWAEGKVRMNLLNRQGQIDTELQKMRGWQEMNLVKERGQIEMRLQQADAQTRKELLNRQGQIDLQLQNLRGSQSMDLQRLQGSQSLQQIAAQGNQNVRLSLLDRDTQMQLQNLRGNQAERLANIEAEHRQKLQTSQSATLLYGQTADSIGQILANPEIPHAQKQGLVDRQLDLLQNGMSLMGKMEGNNRLGNVLQFGRENPVKSSPNVTWDRYNEIAANVRQRQAQKH